jgi:hypothetical protein
MAALVHRRFYTTLHQGARPETAGSEFIVDALTRTLVGDVDEATDVV